jgi:hypothetical protein
MLNSIVDLLVSVFIICLFLEFFFDIPAFKYVKDNVRKLMIPKVKDPPREGKGGDS